VATFPETATDGIIMGESVARALLMLAAALIRRIIVDEETRSITVPSEARHITVDEETRSIIV